MRQAGQLNEGEVYWFEYLWTHEEKAGKDEGAKDRRCCLLMKMKNHIFMAPITSQEPLETEDTKRVYLPIPAFEARLVGLREVSYLVLDEMNAFPEESTAYLRGLTPEGQFSDGFRKQIAKKLYKARKSGLLRVVPRKKE